MKKNINLLFLVFLIFFAEGCEKQLLDKKPLDIITDAQVWNDPNLIKAYVDNLYSRAPMSGLYMAENPALLITTLVVSDEGCTNYVWNTPDRSISGSLDASGGELEYWDYTLIRDINSFLINIKTGTVPEDDKKQYSAQVRFLRALAYFEMVKRYGGVPIVLKPQNITDGDALFVPRNKEKEVYDLIGKECDTISAVLPESYSSSDIGRVTKYAALALKSRAMLYAASIAKYGTEQLDGLVGIPKSDANSYWQASLDASKAIMDDHKFELFNKYPEDKAKNYQMIFLEKDNSEIILAKKFISKIYGHGFDDQTQPNFNYTYWGGCFSPSMELADAFEMKDGSSGVIDWPNIKGQERVIFKNKDPRFEASIMYNGQQWAWDTCRIWKGIYTETGEAKNSETEQYKGMDEVGRDQKTSQGPTTGFLLKKFLDPTKVFPLDLESDQDWILFRYAEILLNYAEASFELDHPDDALDPINQIRTRAGITALGSVTLDQIRQERRIELVFETHRFWDIRRWRIADQFLGKNLHGAYPYYHFATNQFEYEVGNADFFNRVWKQAYYYYPINETRINNNPKLIENPGYN